MDAVERSVTGDTGVRAVTRVIDLLELFDTAHPARSIKELVEGTGLPKTTVLRLCATLCARNVLTARTDGTFGLGPGMLRWVRLAGRMWTPSDEVAEVMRELSRDTGETVNLYVREGLSRIVVAQCESSATVRSVIPVGVPYPLWAGAAGKVLLQAAPELLPAVAAESPRGPEYEKELGAAVDAARERGYALVHGEREMGASGLAFPVTDAHARVVAALTVGGPTGRFTEDRVARYVEATRSAAAKIAALGLPGID
ncbi:IclR family transcriptional regulator [Nocardia sp. CA-135398]|uniref:IclR family transcriptional regulator n=1 Tax=Nocardia sp. CA-135398 TaxID=3239977 RepID=UPI003D97EF19